MPSGSSPRFSSLKIAAACVALGLHAAVLAMVLSAPVVEVAQGRPEALDVQFVELGPALEPEPVAAAEPQPPAEMPPEPEPEPVIQPEPEPAVEPEPEPTPEPVVETPEPESITEPPPPEPKPKPKPKPKPRPKPVHKPQPKPQVQAQPAAPAAASRDAVAAGGARQASEARGEPVPVDPDRPRTVGQVDYLGKRPSPVYPRISQRRGEQGRVVLRVLISPLGQVASVSVRTSSGYTRLDEAAVDAMRHARFRPYTENGIAYKALVDIPFDFVL
ncbi:energy transducer TonB [Castellaniella daejeonensis]|jgi:protein TonB